ncbi:MAG: beta-galactosidase, partial [Acidobacteriota bacterium]
MSRPFFRIAAAMLLCAGLLLPAARPCPAAGSAVGREAGLPSLVIDGKPVTSGFFEIYYYPSGDVPIANQPEYRDPRWLGAMRRVVDLAVAQGLRLVMASVWWGDLDVSARRPDNPAAAVYDFRPLDEFMAYARQRKVAVILKTSANHFLPAWWLAENGFPPGAGYQERSQCRVCETDAYGTAYANPSLGSLTLRRDYGAFVTALVTRYRSQQALAGWAFGLGPTGEDAYGPNYIVVDAPGGGKGLGRRPMMFTDYSPDFTARFKDWLAAKYGSEAALRRAWNDPAISLANFRTPPPAELVRDPAAFSREPFPDPAIERHFDLPAVLTPKGLDFYAFRVYAREADTDYYARLIKSLDPNHVLLFNARVRASARNHPAIDGIFFNPHPRFGQPLFFEANQLYTVLRSVEAITAAGKIALVASENGAERTPVAGRYESPEQINYLMALGQGVKSLGGLMGYAVDLLDVGAPNHFLPTWFSEEANAAERAIEAYRPKPGRGPCDAILDLRGKNHCDAGTASPLGCGLIELAFINYCHADTSCDANHDGRVSEEEFAACRGSQARPGAGPPPQGTAPGAAPGGAGVPAGRCGDGVCDDFERAKGVCPQDCAAAGGASAPTGSPAGATGWSGATSPSGSTAPGTPGGVSAPATPGRLGGSGGTGASPGKCGDGICDDFERSKGVCPKDCAAAGGASAPTGSPAGVTGWSGATSPSGSTAPGTPGGVSAPGAPATPGGSGGTGASPGKCGDGICDDFERAKGVCPQDCGASGGAAGSTSALPGSSVGIAPARAGTSVGSGAAAGKCGDGVCDDFERTKGVCQQDCGAGPGTATSGP